jgi:hypothetical protein
MTEFEEANFLIDVMASGGTRRGEHDQRGGIIERGKGLLSKRCTGVEIVAVAKDRSQGFRDRPQGGFTTNNILVDGKAFETPVNPFPHGHVGMAVGQKRAIFKARHAASVGLTSNFAILAEAASLRNRPRHSHNPNMERLRVRRCVFRFSQNSPLFRSKIAEHIHGHSGGKCPRPT